LNQSYLVLSHGKYDFLIKLVYNVYLITLQTILAHGIYLEDIEVAILKERETAIIHCPTSNTYLKSGLCDVRKLKANNIEVGLGTGATRISL